MKNKIKLKTRYEDQGHNGERRVMVPIMYDPETGKEYDIADIYEVGNDINVHNSKQIKAKH